MAGSLFTRDTLLDVSVNLFPLAIMLLFLVLFLVVAPWGASPSLIGLVQVGLLLVPIVLLSLLTYVAARVVELDD